MKKRFLVAVIVAVMLLTLPFTVLGSPGDPGGSGGGGKPPYEPPGQFSICLIGDGYCYDYPATPVAPPNDDCQGEDED